MVGLILHLKFVIFCYNLCELYDVIDFNQEEKFIEWLITFQRAVRELLYLKKKKTRFWENEISQHDGNCNMNY